MTEDKQNKLSYQLLKFLVSEYRFSRVDGTIDNSGVLLLLKKTCLGEEKDGKEDRQRRRAGDGRGDMQWDRRERVGWREKKRQ